MYLALTLTRWNGYIRASVVLVDGSEGQSRQIASTRYKVGISTLGSLAALREGLRRLERQAEELEARGDSPYDQAELHWG